MLKVAVIDLRSGDVSNSPQDLEGRTINVSTLRELIEDLDWDTPIVITTDGQTFRSINQHTVI